MSGSVLFWLPLAVSAGLLVALILVLRRLYSLQAAGPKAAPVLAPEGWSKLDELLSMLLSLQEHGVSHSGAISREEFGRAVLDSACQLMKCDRNYIMIWDEKEGCLKIVAARSLGAGGGRGRGRGPGGGGAGGAGAAARPGGI